MMQGDSIYTAMKPFLILSNLSGVYPTFRKELRPALWFTHSVLISVILGYTSFGVILWLQEVDYLLYDSLMHLSIEKAQKGFLYFTYITIWVSAIYYHRQFNNLLSDIDQIENSLTLIGMHITYQMHSVVFVGLIKFTMVAVLFIFDYFVSSDTHWLYTAVDLITTHGTLIPIFTFQLQFYAMLTFVAQHFLFIKTKLHKTMAKIAFENRFPKMYELIRIYDRLQSICLKLNRILSIPILITVASIFFHGIVNIHLIAIAGPYKHYLLLTFLLGGLILRMYELWTIINPFVTITREVDAFNAVLFRLMIQDRTGDFTDDDKLYLHITMKKGICFTAWDFFILDNTLIQSVVGAALTLLVILIQYSLSKRKLWCEDI